jgi:predicted methyltransferase
MILRSFAAALALAAVFTAAPTAAGDVPDYVAKAVADTTRPKDDAQLDVARKPTLVLAYAGIKPGMTIAEYLPGGGYYTRLLSDIVGPNGKVYALETTTWGQGNIDAAKALLKEPNRANVALDLSPLGTFQQAEKVDLFWTSINYHDLHIPKYANVDMAAFNKLVFDALKPGGVYFIIDHQAPAGSGATLSPTLHRIEKSTVISEVTAAGFKLVGESDILKNPADDHTKIVFDPSIRFHTDQFILKFQKP